MTENERKDYLIAFGRRVRYYREKLGLTQKELGVRAGYTDGTNPSASISKIELGQVDITQTKAAELAAALSLEPYELITSPQVSHLVKYAELMQKGGADVDI